MSSRTRTPSSDTPARVTIRDVARAPGVSLGTASRALNRSGPVSEAALQAATSANGDRAFTSTTFAALTKPPGICLTWAIRASR